jgi:hypothetical protein
LGTEESSVQDIRKLERSPAEYSELQRSPGGKTHHSELSEIGASNDLLEARDREPAVQYEDMDLESLEEEIARVRKRKERLLYLQSLEEQEELLKHAVAKKKGMA